MDELASTLADISDERETLLSRVHCPSGINGARVAAVLGATTQRWATTPRYQQCDCRSLNRLSDLTRGWLGGNWQASNREFELLLSDLRAGDGGALLAAHSLVSREAGTRQHAACQQLRPQRRCAPYGAATDRSRALEQVVARFFVGAVQPWLVQLRQRTELLLGPVTNLELPLSAALSPRYRAWVVERDQLLTHQTELIRAHIANIQATLARCSPRPAALFAQSRHPWHCDAAPTLLH